MFMCSCFLFVEESCHNILLARLPLDNGAGGWLRVGYGREAGKYEIQRKRKAKRGERRKRNFAAITQLSLIFLRTCSLCFTLVYYHQLMLLPPSLLLLFFLLLCPLPREPILTSMQFFYTTI